MSAQMDIMEGMEIAAEQIRDAVEALKNLGKQAEHEGILGSPEVYRLERGALAHIEMALSNDHQYLGGDMNTIQDTILAVKHAGDGCPECGAEMEEVDPGRYGCPAGC